jgi:hypothetical protein
LITELFDVDRRLYMPTASFTSCPYSLSIYLKKKRSGSVATSENVEEIDQECSEVQ